MLFVVNHCCFTHLNPSFVYFSFQINNKPIQILQFLDPKMSQTDKEQFDAFRRQMRRQSDNRRQSDIRRQSAIRRQSVRRPSGVRRQSVQISTADRRRMSLGYENYMNQFAERQEEENQEQIAALKATQKEAEERLEYAAPLTEQLQMKKRMKVG